MRTAPAAERLRVLDLYFRLANSNEVGETLGISGAAVRERLRAMGVTLMQRGVLGQSPESVNDMNAIRELRHRLAVAAEQERRLRPQPTPGDVEAEVLALYQDGMVAIDIAAQLEISPTSVFRLLRIAGVNRRPRGPYVSPEEQERRRQWALRCRKRRLERRLRREFGTLTGPWLGPHDHGRLRTVPLDATAGESDQLLHDVHGDQTAADPFIELQRKQVREIVGVVDPDTLSEFALARLRRRLLDAGVTPPATQRRSNKWKSAA